MIRKIHFNQQKSLVLLVLKKIQRNEHKYYSF